MRGLRRVGITLIILAILVPPLANYGPYVFYEARYRLGLHGPNFPMHDHAYEGYLWLAYTSALILAGFGILFLRDAARKRKTTPDDETS